MTIAKSVATRQITTGPASSAQYRDRAKERRDRYGAPSPPRKKYMNSPPVPMAPPPQAVPVELTPPPAVSQQQPSGECFPFSGKLIFLTMFCFLNYIKNLVTSVDN